MQSLTFAWQHRRKPKLRHQSYRTRRELAALMSRDRLLSVGDLMDREPDSAAVLEWLDLPWFAAPRKNQRGQLVQDHFEPSPVEPQTFEEYEFWRW